jgi:1-acyl-sn-glycerol-3-phosphate acyltransferase
VSYTAGFPQGYRPCAAGRTTLPSVRPVTVRFGAPLKFTDRGGPESARARRLVDDRIMDAVGQLSGQERAGTYTG